MANDWSMGSAASSVTSSVVNTVANHVSVPPVVDKAALQLQTLALNTHVRAHQLLDFKEDQKETFVKGIDDLEHKAPAEGLQIPEDGQRLIESVENTVDSVHFPGQMRMRSMLNDARRQSYVVPFAPLKGNLSHRGSAVAMTLFDAEQAWRQFQQQQQQRNEGRAEPARAYQFINKKRRERFVSSAITENDDRVHRRFSVGDPDAPKCPAWQAKAATKGPSRKLNQHYPFSEFSQAELSDHVVNAANHKSYFKDKPTVGQDDAEVDRDDHQKGDEDSSQQQAEEKPKRINNNETDDENDDENPDQQHRGSVSGNKYNVENPDDEDDNDDDFMDGYPDETSEEINDDRVLDATDALESTRRAAQRTQLNEVLTQITMLECAANKFRALSGAQWRPSREKFTQQILRPLFLDMMRTHAYEHVHMDPIESISKTRIADFLDIYMELCMEKLSENRYLYDPFPRARILADYCNVHGCSFVVGYEQLCASGWDPQNRAKGMKAATPDQKTEIGTPKTLEALCTSIRNYDLAMLYRAIPHCTDKQLIQGILLAVSMSHPDSRIVKLLSELVNHEVHRKAFLLVASRDREDVLGLLGRLLPSLSNDVKREAFLIATKRGALSTMKSTLGFADEKTLHKAVQIAAAVDHMHIVRRLLPLLPKNTWEKLWAMGGKRTLRFYEVMSTQRGFRWTEFGETNPAAKPIPEGIVCEKFMHVELLLSTLQLMHRLTFTDKILCDLQAGKGQAILAACLSQSFASAIGYEENAELRQEGGRAVESFEADMENLFVPSFEDVDDENNEEVANIPTQTIPDIRFQAPSSAMRAFADAHLVFATPASCSDLDVRTMREGAILAIYKPTPEMKLSHRKRALCKVQDIQSPLNEQYILWQVFLRRDQDDDHRRRKNSVN